MRGQLHGQTASQVAVSLMKMEPIVGMAVPEVMALQFASVPGDGGDRGSHPEPGVKEAVAHLWTARGVSSTGWEAMDASNYVCIVSRQAVPCLMRRDRRGWMTGILLQLNKRFLASESAVECPRTWGSHHREILPLLLRITSGSCRALAGVLLRPRPCEGGRRMSDRPARLTARQGRVGSPSRAAVELDDAIVIVPLPHCPDRTRCCDGDG